MLSYILEIIDSIGDSIVNFIDIYSFKLRYNKKFYNKC